MQTCPGLLCEVSGLLQPRSEDHAGKGQATAVFQVEVAFPCSQDTESRGSWDEVFQAPSQPLLHA